MADKTVSWVNCSSSRPKAPPRKVRCVLVDGEAPFAVEADFDSVDEAMAAAEPKLVIGVWTHAYIYNDHGTLIEQILAPPFVPGLN